MPNTNGDQVTIQKDDRPYLSLGADLTEEQRATVLGLMGIDPAGLANYDVVYVTNQEEHQYLGAYIDASKIGTGRRFDGGAARYSAGTDGDRSGGTGKL